MLIHDVFESLVIDRLSVDETCCTTNVALELDDMRHVLLTRDKT